jgi:hypothetical protein
MADKVGTARDFCLNWIAPMRITTFTHGVLKKEAIEDAMGRGVYIWGFTIAREFTPYYVGIADNILVRIYQHIQSILSGAYTIYHYSSLASFKDFKDKTARADQPSGKLYEPHLPHGFKDFLHNRLLLQPHIDFMVDKFTFSYAIVEKEIASNQELKEIEKICIHQIGPGKLANTRAGDFQRFSMSHNGLNLFDERMNAPTG